MQKLTMCFLAGALPAGPIFADPVSSVTLDSGALPCEQLDINTKQLPSNNILPDTATSSIRGDWITDPQTSVTLSLCLKEPLAESALQLMPGLSFFAKTQQPQQRYIYHYRDTADITGFSFPELAGLDHGCSAIRVGDNFSFLANIQSAENCPLEINYHQHALLITLSNSNHTTPEIYTYGGDGGGGCFGWLCCWKNSERGGSSRRSGGTGSPGKNSDSSASGGDDGKRPNQISDYSIQPPETTMEKELENLLRQILRASSTFKKARIEELANALSSSQHRLNPTTALFSWLATLQTPISTIDIKAVQTQQLHEQWNAIFTFLSQHPNTDMTTMTTLLNTVASPRALKSVMTRILEGELN